MAYHGKVTVRFADEDHAGIVYYPRFFDFFHQVFEDFFNDSGIPYIYVLDVDKIGWPAVHAEADYRHPLRFGDVLDVEMRVESIGKASTTFLYTGRRAADALHIVDAKMIVCCMDMNTQKATPIPDKYRKLFVSLQDKA